MIRYSAIAMITASSLAAQLANEAEEEAVEEDVVQLNPFEVSASDVNGYQANSTLAGNRVRTDLRDIAAPVQAITKQFLKDTGTLDQADLLIYTTSTEVAGPEGNFGGLGNAQGVAEGFTIRPTNRVRGLAAADNTRGFFLTDIPWDSYNTERVEISRGPNSMLFGVGSPAGIVNTTLTAAHFNGNEREFQSRVSSFGSLRNSFDINHVLIEDTLAVRAVLLEDQEKFRQKPAFEDDSRAFIAMQFEPKLIGPKGSTRFRASFETGDIDANRPRTLAPVDAITSWWNIGQAVYDPYYAQEYGILPALGILGTNPELSQPWYGAGLGSTGGAAPKFFYNNGSDTPIAVRQGATSRTGGLAPDGSVDGSIFSINPAQPRSLNGYNGFVRNVHQLSDTLGQPSPFPGALSNFYKDFHITDTSIYDFYNNLIDGDIKSEKADWDAINLSLSQSFLNGRLAIELVYDKQDYSDSFSNLLGGRPTFGIDVNTHIPFDPTQYGVTAPGGPVPNPADVTGGVRNPNVGRAFISGGSGGQSASETTRESVRFSAYAEVRGSDFFKEDSFLAKLIGRNSFSGLVTSEERETLFTAWQAFATDTQFPDFLGRPQDQALGADTPRAVGYAVYLTDDLRGVSSPSGLNLSRLETAINPAGNNQLQFWDSTWNAPGVDPAATYTDLLNGFTRTESENFANYVGLSTTNVNILNASAGDRDQLLTTAVSTSRVLDSVGLTWQGHLWDGMIVPTYGWREDEVESWSNINPLQSGTNLATIPTQRGSEDPNVGGYLLNKGQSQSWGVVFHSEHLIGDSLPWGTKVSMFYNEGENYQPLNRFTYNGIELDNPSGETTDFGFVLQTLDDRMTLRVTKYETTVTNANFSGNALGNAGYLSDMERWMVANAFITEGYWAGDASPNQVWQGNWGAWAEGQIGNPQWTDPRNHTDEVINHPENVAARAAAADLWNNLLPQNFYDAYGIPVNTANSGSYEARQQLIDNGNFPATSGVWQIGKAGGGAVFGTAPTVASDSKSEGYEIELLLRPTNNWDISFNAVQTEAVNLGLDQETVEFIDLQRERLAGPLGDIRIWWVGDRATRDQFESNVGAAFDFTQSTVGFDLPEVRQWNMNAVTNYRFNEGALKGLNLGGAVRYQDDYIIGYGITETSPDVWIQDPNQPYYAGGDTKFDLWAGYSRKLTEKVNWSIQLNLKNVGASKGLVPISVQPDGTTAASRIEEGMTWAISNTFQF